MSQQGRRKVMDWGQLAEILDLAVKDLFRLDGDLLGTATHQRTYCARLAWYLERHLPPHLRASQMPNTTLPRQGYVVDVEYNRADGSESKILHRTRKSRRDDRARVLPDLIVHQRGPAGPNLCVIEVAGKTTHKPAYTIHNFWKLAGYVCEYSYQYGLYLCFETGTDTPTIAEAWLLDRDRLGQNDGAEDRLSRKECEGSIARLAALSDEAAKPEFGESPIQQMPGIRKQLGFAQLGADWQPLRR